MTGRVVDADTIFFYDEPPRVRFWYEDLRR